MENPQEKLIIALDDVDFDSAIKIATLTKPFASTFKVGLSLFTAWGPEIIKELKELSVDVFLDLKLFDIPMQTKKAVQAALKYEPRFLTVHAMGGKKMLSEASVISQGSNTTLLAVSVLTSFDQQDYADVGFKDSINDGVVRLLDLAFVSGIRGFVASPQELIHLRKRFGSDCFLVCPGVRPRGSDLNDQSRVMTPKEAIMASANALVVGRPITKAPNIVEAAQGIYQDIESALKPGMHNIMKTVEAHL